MRTLSLKPGRDAATRRRHPWLFAGAVAREAGGGPDGLVEARAADGTFLARGFASPRSPLVARWWTFADEPVDAALALRRLDDAMSLRTKVVPPETDGYRVVNAEGDFLPGLVVDRYAGVLSVQSTTEGTERARPLWLPALRSRFPGATILQRNDLPSRAAEGLPTEDERLAGEASPPRAPFRERGLSFLADLAGGQKTGFFLDQRENRDLVRRHAAGRRVLNLFSYSGAFGVAALAGGAVSVTHVDASAPALELAREHHARNGQAGADFVAADVFEDLRARVAAGEAWDLIVTDPPAFAKRRGDVERACRGYKDVNRLALKLLAPGGLLLACSCSGPVEADLFQKVLFAAALDAGVPARILEKRGAGPDHPVSVDCPEGEYLKAFLLARRGPG
ncbi:MAG TPA: class I SAM-dependent rRNA methyltransferase [Thermoanaerobaculia bacterium]|nr:class I SAM-dependent rRNA methyltransferase [Thermoanaerobaculia bacterium]HQR68469.1 class I SAM-dependent rRNA methyltransferase [Thermoanaerobaculia bacterium]